MHQTRIVRIVAAAIHVVFIAILIWQAWQALEPRSWAGGPGFIGTGVSTIVGMSGLALASAMAGGLIWWLKTGQIAILATSDLVLMGGLGLLVWYSFEVGFVACIIALAVALRAVLTDRSRQRSAPSRTGSTPEDSP